MQAVVRDMVGRGAPGAIVNVISSSQLAWIAEAATTSLREHRPMRIDEVRAALSR